MNIDMNTRTIADAQNVAQVGDTGVVSSQSSGDRQLLAELAKGSIFAGEITEGLNDTVTVTLSNGDTFNARMDQGVNLSKDQLAYFLVSSNDKGKVSLKLLTQNQNASPTILKALAQAGFDPTDRAIDMVKSMMDKSMPIDPDNVGSMVKTAYVFNEERVDDLTSLKKLGININEANLEQIKNYDNGEGKLETPLTRIAKEIPNFVGKSGSSDVMSDIANVLSEDLSEVKKSQIDGNKYIISIEESDKAIETSVKQKVDIDSLLKDIAAKTGEIDRCIAPKIDLLSGKELEEVKQLLQGENGAENTEKAQLQNPEESGNGTVNNLKQDLNIEELLKNSLKNTADNAGDEVNPEKVLEELKNGELPEDVKEKMQEQTEISPEKLAAQDSAVNDKQYTKLLLELTELLKNNSFGEAATKDILNSKEFKGLFEKALKEQFFVEPDKLKNKEEVDKLYNRINKQLSKIYDTLNSNKNVPESLTKDIIDVKNNLSFINEANHLYQYVQIPLKMASEHATGDLYVFTNKKRLLNPNEEITAHLHLEMEHLGTTDVDIALKQKKLQTHFMLADEDSLNLVLEHIDILTKRLSDKGFAVNIDASKMGDGKEETFMEKIMGAPLPKISYSKMAFDVKV
ncbi:MAG: flagellar hook-length control protein FliK [Lachnospiraceae bacterium]|nr:flagellar hook-length control protein FliK [Lachnospiraceae bacterium]